MMELETETQNQDEKMKKRRRHEDPTDFVHRIPPPEAKRRKKGKDKESKEKSTTDEIDILALNELKEVQRDNDMPQPKRQFHTISKLSSRSLFMSLPVSAPEILDINYNVNLSELNSDQNGDVGEDGNKRKKTDSPAKFFKTLSTSKKR